MTHADLRSLAQEIRGEIREGHRSLALDLGSQVQTARREINERLDVLNGRTALAHEKISRLEGIVDFLAASVQTFRRNVHDLSARVQRWVGRLERMEATTDANADADGGGGEKRPVTMRDVYVALAAVTATVAVIKFIGLIP